MGANLSIQHLVGRSFALFNARPFTCCGMWFVYAIFQAQSTRRQKTDSVDLPPDVDPEFFAKVAFMVFVWGIIAIFVGPALKGGFQHTVLRMLRGAEKVQFSDIFSGFDKYFKLLGASLIFVFLVILGVYLLVIPGIIVSLGLWPVFLIIVEEDCTLTEAFQKAWVLTNGYKKQLFVYSLFAGLLYIAGLLVFCLGVFFTGPIAEMGFVVAYDELQKAQSLDKIKPK